MMLTFITEATIRSSALIASVWVLLRACRVREPGGEKLAWTLVMAASLAMPLLAWLTVAHAIPLQIVPSRLTVSMDRMTDVPPEAHLLGAAFLTVYLLGAATFAARLGVGLFMGARLRREARRALVRESDLDVRLSAEVAGPVSFGSTVLLPTCSISWHARTLQAVLAHEREHIRNHDGYRLWLASVCRAIFWFNPLVHWLYRRLTILTELTSDAAAVVVVGDRAAYVDVLLQLATGASSFEAASPMAMQPTLPGRIRELLTLTELPVRLPERRKVPLGSIVPLLSVLIAACGAEPVTGAAAISALQVHQAPTIAELKELYPHELRRRRIAGMVLVRITVDASGRVVKTSIVKETPAGVGLGEAAERVARAYSFDNSLHRPVMTTMPVKFALQHSSAGSPVPDPGPTVASQSPNCLTLSPASSSSARC
jgi:bla regulator protein blaR1